MSARKHTIACASIGSTPTRLRLEDDRQKTGLITVSEETVTSHSKRAVTLSVITALDLDADQARWLRDALTSVLEGGE